MATHHKCAITRSSDVGVQWKSTAEKDILTVTYMSKSHITRRHTLNIDWSTDLSIHTAGITPRAIWPVSCEAFMWKWASVPHTSSAGDTRRWGSIPKLFCHIHSLHDKCLTPIPKAWDAGMNIQILFSLKSYNCCHSIIIHGLNAYGVQKKVLEWQLQLSGT